MIPNISSDHDQPIFTREWWLDSVCAPSEKFGYAQVYKNNVVVARMPWIIRKNKFGLKHIFQPKLTRRLGPYIFPISQYQKASTVFNNQMAIYKELIAQLPFCHYFSQSFSTNFTNWLPFYWSGFKQTTRYTYRFDSLDDLDSTWAGFDQKIRTDIRKATNTGIVVDQSDDIKQLYDLLCLSYARQNLPPPYDFSLLKRLFTACLKHNCAAVSLARDRYGNAHAGMMLVWDRTSAYYLVGGGNPHLRSSGATSLLLWNAIKYTKSLNRSFDFEGSMLPAIEKHFRGFGASLTPYSLITRVSPNLVSLQSAFQLIKPLN